MKVLLDTSALMIPGNFGIDVISEIEKKYPEARFFTLKSVIRELKHISENGSGKEKKSAKLGLKLSKKVEIILEDGDVDPKLLDLSDEYAICTTDMDIVEELREEGKPVFYLKQKKYIASENIH